MPIFLDSWTLNMRSYAYETKKGEKVVKID